MTFDAPVSLPPRSRYSVSFCEVGVSTMLDCGGGKGNGREIGVYSLVARLCPCLTDTSERSTQRVIFGINVYTVRLTSYRRRRTS